MLRRRYRKSSYSHSCVRVVVALSCTFVSGISHAAPSAVSASNAVSGPSTSLGGPASSPHSTPSHIPSAAQSAGSGIHTSDVANGCGANTSPATTPAVGQSIEKPKEPDYVARVIASLGLVLALANFGYAFQKDRKAWKRSIEDDFWFRKLVSPTVIEPVVKTITELLDGLPGAATLAVQQQQFALDVTKRFIRLRVNLPMLALLSSDLPLQVSQSLDACEELFTEHCSQVAQGITTTGTLMVAEAVWAEVQPTLATIMTVQMKKHQ